MDNPNQIKPEKMSSGPVIWKWLLPLAFVLVTIGVVAILLLRSCNDNPELKTEKTEQASEHQYQPFENADTEGSRLSYGKWTGEIKYGQPHGEGTLTYTTRRLVSQSDPKTRVAEPGDYIIGEFDCGQLVRGKLYRTNGTVEDIITVQAGSIN